MRLPGVHVCKLISHQVVGTHRGSMHSTSAQKAHSDTQNYLFNRFQATDPNASGIYSFKIQLKILNKKLCGTRRSHLLLNVSQIAKISAKLKLLNQHLRCLSDGVDTGYCSCAEHLAIAWPCCYDDELVERLRTLNSIYFWTFLSTYFMNYALLKY